MPDDAWSSGSKEFGILENENFHNILFNFYRSGNTEGLSVSEYKLV